MMHGQKNIKSLFVASSWFLFYLLIKDARSFEHNLVRYRSVNNQV